MTYWDASALVPLLVTEAATNTVQSWLHEDANVVTWVWTRVEITSAIERRYREGTVSMDQRRELISRLTVIARQWDEVTDILVTRKHAQRILAHYPLRAADAAQLAAAIIACEGDPGGERFACLDHRLAEAAELEGFTVLNTAY